MQASTASSFAYRPHRLAAWRRALLAWLLIALPLHAVGATITQWLGARHFHTSTTAEAVMVDWQFVRRIEIGVGAEPSTSLRAETHSHRGVERHRHSPLDGSVVALDDAGHDRAASSAGSGAAGAGATPAQPFAVPSFALAPADQPSASATAWPVHAGPPRPRLSAERLERPPQA